VPLGEHAVAVLVMLLALDGSDIDELPSEGVIS
jgi:hypothetical protein